MSREMYMYYSCLHCHLQQKIDICDGQLNPELILLVNSLNAHLILHIHSQDLHFLLRVFTQHKQYHTPLRL